MSTPDIMRNRLAFMLVGAFVAMLPFFLFKDLPTSNKDIITYMLGQLSGMATMALGHYFTNRAGQDALDEKRADNTGKLADAVVAAANATPGIMDGQDVSSAADAVASAAVDRAEEFRP